MRYYEFILCADAEYIEDNAKIRLRDYAYNSPIEAMNCYMYRNMDCDASFFVYRAEGDRLLSTFAYNDRKSTMQEAFDSVFRMLNDDFQINRMGSDPEEITMSRFFDCITESKRRGYTHPGRMNNTFSDRFYDYYNIGVRSPNDNSYGRQCAFSEFIIPEGSAKRYDIYDKSLVDELANIEAHENTMEGACSMVHYILSSRSPEAGREMSEALARSLYKAKRVSAGRVEVLKDLHPEAYKGNGFIEEIIENNFGGTVIIDLSARFGYAPEDYAMTGRYLEKVFKQYRNDCLFIFTYDMDDPGFAYYLLPEISKYAIPVMLREGSSDRAGAVEYLKSLIEKTDCAGYADQAHEFMDLYPGDVFTQTDVLKAFEKFEPWCVNRNVLKAYNYELSDDFMLDRDAEDESAYDKLNKLIGLDIVKKQIDDIIASHIVEKERERFGGRKYQARSLHMVFGGNPGTAKTTVAELFAGIAKEKGILKSGICVVRGGMDLYSAGCVRSAFTAAKGGVLFIDEAYAMMGPFFSSAITTLVQEMENRRDEVIVILAGYKEAMKEFLETNEGLKSRIPNWIDFPDYSIDELTEMFKLNVAERGFKAAKGAVDQARYILEKARYMDDFGNGRYVRNLVDRAVQNQSVRLMSGCKDAKDVNRRDLFTLKKEDITALDEDRFEERPAGAARRELDDMIGLTSVKNLIDKVIASYNMNKYCLEKGMAREKPSLHMVFTGNPGTAKTTVARLVGEMLRDEKVLPSGHFVEVGRADLVGQFSGHTPIKVREAFRKARGGVLFIDEAYSLCDGYEGGYGDEAINTIVQEMENHRDDTIVIFAGYPEPMKRFLERNPGMRSRITFNVQFEDYTTEELCDITRLMASKENMTLTDEAMEKLRRIYDSAREEVDYGNGRFVRRMLEEAEMNIAQSLVALDRSEITNEQLTTIDEQHIPDVEPGNEMKSNRKKRIGFVG